MIEIDLNSLKFKEQKNKLSTSYAVGSNFEIKFSLGALAVFYKGNQILCIEKEVRGYDPFYQQFMNDPKKLDTIVHVSELEILKGSSSIFSEQELENLTKNILMYENVLNHLADKDENKEAWLDAKNRIEDNLQFHYLKPYTSIVEAIKVKHGIDIADLNDLINIYGEGQFRADYANPSRKEIQKRKPGQSKWFKHYLKETRTEEGEKKYYKKRDLYLEKNISKPTVNIDEIIL